MTFVLGQMLDVDNTSFCYVEMLIRIEGHSFQVI